MTEKTSYKINNFLTIKNSPESEKVSFAELVEIFHCVKHNISYNSLNCGIKLLPQLFPDSAIVKKLSCGRTKAESIVKEVLGSKAEEIVLKTLKNPETILEGPIHCNEVYFSIIGLLDFVKPTEESRGCMRRSTIDFISFKNKDFYFLLITACFFASAAQSILTPSPF